MRSLVYAILTASLFAAVLYFGGGALGVWDELPEVPRAAAEPSTTSADPAAPAQRKNPNDAKRELIAADNALARSAVLQKSDMLPQWRKTRLRAMRRRASSPAIP
jgi:hypothetical protein